MVPLGRRRCDAYGDLTFASDGKLGKLAGSIIKRFSVVRVEKHKFKGLEIPVLGLNYYFVYPYRIR